MLEIKEGQKAVIIDNDGSHAFAVDELVTFIGYGVIDDEDNYYEYEFVNENGLQQSLISMEFELLCQN